MKAFVITGFGGTDVLEEREWPKPEPRCNQVLVRVRATSINPVDYKIRQDGRWAGIKPPAIIGYDVAGVVEAVGECVEHLHVGDEVYYSPDIFKGQGSYAEYQVSDEDIVALKPKNLSFEEAASIPLVGCTALDAIVNLARVQPGETVVVHAAAGGVGSVAVQLAKAAGARVIGTCSRAKMDFVRSLGADLVLDSRGEDLAQAMLREAGLVDVVFDTVGGHTLARSIEFTRPFGRMVSIANTHGDLNSAYRKNLTLYFLFMERARGKLEALTRLIERGQLRPAVDSVLPLSQVAQAHARLERGAVAGKIVLRVD